MSGLTLLLQGSFSVRVDFGKLDDSLSQVSE